ncbi:MAG: GNAT family N-acetyltransferase [Candidatus Aminicenantes bacterium]|nr:GNAT family N-acetyltransferase [Candidatus Aminicenantes bacterium]
MKLEFGEYQIRQWEDRDASTLAKYANNRKIWLNLRDVFPHPYTLSDAKEFIKRVKAQNPRTVFAIASQSEAIGSIGLVLGEDVHRFTAEMGYWLAEPFWNLGIMTDAIKIFSDYALEKFNLIRIFAEPYARNPASARVLEKAGFIREGTMKAHAYKDRKILDMYLYAKTRKAQINSFNLNH